MIQGAPKDSAALSKAVSVRQVTKRQASELPVGLREQLISSESGIASLIGPNKKVEVRSRKGSLYKRSQAYKALLIENGTRPHEITAKKYNKSGVLRIFNKWIRGSVRHPGSRSNPFMANALSQNEPQLTSRFYQGLASRLDKLRAQ